MSIYVRDAGGNRQKIAGVGLPGPAGKSAYQYAVEGGFTGTEEEFRAVVGVRSNPNLLDNWYFADPINQRGQKEYGDNQYAIDRWYCQGTGKLTVNPNYTTIERADLFYNAIQPIDLNEMDLRGKYVTFSCIFQENEDFCVRLLGSNVTIGTTENGFDVRSDKSQIGVLHATALIPSTCRYLQCAITSDRNPTSENPHAIVIAAKLELGPVQTLAHKEGDTWVLNDPPPDPTLELAKCQYFQYTPFSNFNGYGDVASGYIWNETGALFVISCPKMRSTPTLIIDNIAKFQITTKTKTGMRNDITPETIGIQNSIGNCILLWVTVASSYGMEPGAACGLWVGQAPGTVPFLLDANL